MHVFVYEGLIQSMLQQQQRGRKITWFIDNSGSMQTRDAHRTWGNSQSQLQLLDCSRWEEVQDCLYFQMDMTTILQNHHSTFTVSAYISHVMRMILLFLFPIIHTFFSFFNGCLKQYFFY